MLLILKQPRFPFEGRGRTAQQLADLILGNIEGFPQERRFNHSVWLPPLERDDHRQRFDERRNRILRDAARVGWKSSWSVRCRDSRSLSRVEGRAIGIE